MALPNKITMSIGPETGTMTPERARLIAKWLLEAADKAEALGAEEREIAEATARIRAKYRGEKVA